MGSNLTCAALFSLKRELFRLVVLPGFDLGLTVTMCACVQWNSFFQNLSVSQLLLSLSCSLREAYQSCKSDSERQLLIGNLRVGLAQRWLCVDVCGAGDCVCLTQLLSLSLSLPPSLPLLPSPPLSPSLPPSLSLNRKLGVKVGQALCSLYWRGTV